MTWVAESLLVLRPRPAAYGNGAFLVSECMAQVRAAKVPSPQRVETTEGVSLCGGAAGSRS